MNKIPGLKADIGFGSAESKLPDWRKSVLADEADPDDEQIETPEDVKAILGFDPAEDDESEDDMMRETLVNRMAQNRCKDRAWLPEGAVENAGTSEGVKKGWQTRKTEGDTRSSVWERMTPKQRLRAKMRDMEDAARRAEKFKSRNSTMLAQFSPSPMIGSYAKGSKQSVKNGTSLWARFPGKSNEQITAEVGKEVLAKRIARRLSKPAKPMPKPKVASAPVMNSHGENEELEAGIKVEMEHGGGRAAAKKIALDHLREDPKYYSKLKDCGMAK